MSQVWYFDFETVNKYLSKPCNIICAAPWYADWQDEKAHEFIQKYKKEYFTKPLVDDAHTYDMANMLLLAIQSGKHSTREELKDSFKRITHYRGATGWFHFDDCSGHPRKNFFVLQMNRDKNYELTGVFMKEKNPNCK